MAMCALEREISKGVRERLSRHGSRSSQSRRESSQVLVRPPACAFTNESAQAVEESK